MMKIILGCFEFAFADLADFAAQPGRAAAAAAPVIRVKNWRRLGFFMSFSF